MTRETELKPALHAESAMRRSCAPSARPLFAISACSVREEAIECLGLLESVRIGGGAEATDVHADDGDVQLRVLDVCGLPATFAVEMDNEVVAGLFRA